jgi:hypothetical protein
MDERGWYDIGLEHLRMQHTLNSLATARHHAHAPSLSNSIRTERCDVHWLRYQNNQSLHSVGEHRAQTCQHRDSDKGTQFLDMFALRRNQEVHSTSTAHITSPPIVPMARCALSPNKDLHRVTYIHVRRHRHNSKEVNIIYSSLCSPPRVA